MSVLTPTVNWALNIKAVRKAIEWSMKHKLTQGINEDFREVAEKKLKLNLALTALSEEPSANYTDC